MTFSIGQPEQTGLDAILGGAVGGVSQGLQQSLEQFHQQKQLEAETKRFEDQGYPTPLARLAATATTGGKTEVLKEVIDLQKRGGGLFASEEVQEGNGDVQIDKKIGRLPSEQVADERDREKRSFERNKKYFDRISSISEEAPKERVALSQMQGALQDKDFNSWRNTIAEVTGQDWLKNSSAQVVNSASKQFLMSALASLTGRPNQFIEKQITKALISPLYQNEANMLIFEGLKGLSDLKNKEVELALELEEQYTSRGKEVPRNFQKQIKDQLKDESQAFEKGYEELVRSTLTSKEGTVAMRNKKGEVRAVPKEKVIAAQKAGYKKV